jgi:PAS domain S-box-containing protein
MSSSHSASRIAALRWALDSSPHLVYAAGADGRIVYVNAAGRARWGEAATVGASAAGLFAGETRGHLAAFSAQVLASGEAATFDAGEHGASGVRAWATYTVSPLREGAAITGYLCIAADTTALKRAELRLRRSEQLMVDTQGVAHLGTWEWDIREPTAEWSDELYQIYGLTRAHYTPSYDAYLAMVHPDDRQRVIDATNRVFHEHVPYSHDERIFRPDGSLRYLHTWAHPVLDDDGVLTRLVGVCQDITDQKLAEEEVRQLNAALELRVAERTRTIEASLRDVEAFNATVSHDLRAPLSVISLSCAVISKSTGDDLPQPVVDSLARIRRSVSYMTQLVNDLLALAQVGNAPIERTAIDLSQLCEEIVANLRLASPERQVTVEVAPGLRCNVDASLMRAAMENLIGNAWKYSARVAHARIEIGTMAVDGRDVFFVRDNGAGFDMTQAHRLFAPFQRLHAPNEFDGTGVGLAAVQRIIERHSGHIWAEGTTGHGATFFFTLP